MTKHLRLLMLALLAIICTGGVKAAVGDTYELVTSVDELKAGDNIVIGCATKNVALGTEADSKRRKAVNVTISDTHVLAIVDGIDELTLEAANNGWYLKSSTGDYLTASSASNTNLVYNSKGASKVADISFVKSTGNADIKFFFDGTLAKRKIQYNGTSGFFFSTSGTAVQIYKKQDSGKIATTIAFAEGIENSIVTVKDGETFDGYKATCTPEGAKGAIQYSSSNTDVATVDEATGAVTMGSKYGKTVITAQFIGKGGYANSNKISYTIEYKGDYAFYESFNTCAGTGGNGDKFNGTGTDKSEYDNNGWDGTSVSAANKCIKVGSGDKKGSIISPTISVSKDGLLTFKAAAWDARDEKLTIKVSVSSGELTYNNTSAKEQTITLDKGAWKDYEMTVSGTTSFRVTFAAATNESNRFFLDEVMVKEIAAADVTLDEDKDNVVEAAENANVTLKRTLYADGGWNTLCLPFSLTDEQTKAAFGDDVELRTLESVSGNTLTFAQATGITAGVPCLIKVSKVAKDNTYTFTGVTTIAVKDKTDFGFSEKGDVVFVGIYSPADVSEWATAGKENALFLGDGNKFYKAKAETKMKAFRAFFLVPASTDTQALRAVIDGTTTGIDDLNIDTVKADGRVYNLNGQCVGYSLEGLKAGIYIQNGKKVIKK